MLAASNEPSWWIVALPVAGALLGVLIGQLAAEWYRRRAAAEERYDTAISAVARMRSAHHGVGLRFPPEWVRASTDAQYEEDAHELSKEALKRYLDAVAEARAALAALFPWSPDLMKYWDQPFIPENDFEGLMRTLTDRRSTPFQRFGPDGQWLSSH